MDVKWVKIRSWHAVKEQIGEAHLTYCGWAAKGEVRNELPTEKSCESCLRIVARLQDA